jgi:IMP dehydrogenase
MRKCIAFDDVLLVPVYSEGRSRLEVDTSVMVGPLKLEIPLISSPMDTVTEFKMAIALGRAGGMGVIHRFMSPEEQHLEIRKVIDLNGAIPIVPAIGVNTSERDRFLHLFRQGYDIDMISIDVANGHSILMKEMIDWVKQVTHGELPIMAGNVATAEGYVYLAEAGADAVRVGIGGGSICKTRIQTGFGMPTLASVWDCGDLHKENYPSVSIIADGGIRYPADLVKSLAAGADAVICGSIFAGTQEAPGTTIHDNEGVAWKTYRGMACYSEDTEVLTSKGWKLIKDVSIKDKVCTLNSDTHYLEYQNPVKLFDYEYKGDMFEVKSKFINLMVTPNHNLYVGKKNHHRETEYRFNIAQDAYENFRYKNYMYKLGCNWKGKSKDTFTLPNTNIQFNMSEWLDFFGFWLAEGCTYSYKQKKKYNCFVTSFSNNDKTIIDKYSNILLAAGIKNSTRKRNKNYEVRAHNKALYEYLSKFGKAKDKYIPDEFKFLSSEQLNILLDGIFLGDGCSSRHSISTVSVRLADDIYEIGLKAGRAPKITVNRRKGTSHGKFNHNHDLYNINVNKNAPNETFVSFKNVNKVPYSGKVYCVEVPNHIVLVRRDRRAVWCGNSEEMQIDRRGGLKPGTCAEGVSQLVRYKGSLDRVLIDFVGGLRSGLTYANASNIEELRENAQFVRITGSGINESHAHGTRK